MISSPRLPRQPDNVKVVVIWRRVAHSLTSISRGVTRKSSRAAAKHSRHCEGGSPFTASCCHCAIPPRLAGGCNRARPLLLDGRADILSSARPPSAIALRMSAASYGAAMLLASMSAAFGLPSATLVFQRFCRLAFWSPGVVEDVIGFNCNAGPQLHFHSSPLLASSVVEAPATLAPRRVAASNRFAVL
jgi:hypothetical protein